MSGEWARLSAALEACSGSPAAVDYDEVTELYAAAEGVLAIRAAELSADEADLARVIADAGVTDVEVVRSGPPVAIVSSLELGRQGTLNADYYVNRRPGEDAPTYRKRRQAEDAIRRAEGHERHAARLREEARDLIGDDLIPVTSVYERGQADMLIRLAAMDPVQRAELLSRVRHPSAGGERM